MKKILTISILVFLAILTSCGIGSKIESPELQNEVFQNEVIEIQDDIMCTQEYMPVCGKINVQCITTPCDSVMETFSNRCYANKKNAFDIQEGECYTGNNQIDQVSDKEFIKKLFQEKYSDKNNININISKSIGVNVLGQIEFQEDGQQTGAMFLANKNSGDWKIVFEGNGSVSCEIITQYDISKEIVSECWNKEMNNLEIVPIDKEHKEYIPWSQAIEILNEGNVKTVSQLHNLDVSLYFNDGTIIKTKEPRIDLIFDEVKKCGEVCKNIILITE